jgi:hypothetical protein
MTTFVTSLLPSFIVGLAAYISITGGFIEPSKLGI